MVLAYSNSDVFLSQPWIAVIRLQTCGSWALTVSRFPSGAPTLPGSRVTKGWEGIPVLVWPFSFRYSSGEGGGWQLRDSPARTDQGLWPRFCLNWSLHAAWIHSWVLAKEGFAIFHLPQACILLQLPILGQTRLWSWNPRYIQVTTSRARSSELIYYITLEFWQRQYKTWTRPVYERIVGKVNGKSILVNPVRKTTKNSLSLSEPDEER